MTMLDAIAARLYAAGYDATVAGFGPYERLVAEIAGLIERGAGGAPARVLDIACGTGSVARRLARRGHAVVGCDVVPALVEVARRRTPRALAGRVDFSARDVALAGPPAVDAFDAVVVMHTLYWHPHPDRLLLACHAALRPGGHAIVVSYQRPAAVRPTVAAVRRAEGCLAAAGALRWLVPTAAFEALRRIPKRYVDERAVRGLLARAGFVVRESRPAFLGDVSVLAWARRGTPLDEDGAMGAPSMVLQPSWSGRP
jgi:SAM-dependent methyltransferase